MDEVDSVNVDHVEFQGRLATVIGPSLHGRNLVLVCDMFGRNDVCFEIVSYGREKRWVDVVG